MNNIKRYAGSKTLPEHITITRASKKHEYKIRIAENARKTSRTSPDGDIYDWYQFNTISNIVFAPTRADLISSIIHLKYSLDDEAALINKAITDSGNEEYIEYREFVAEVKAEVDELLVKKRGE